MSETRRMALPRNGSTRTAGLLEAKLRAPSESSLIRYQCVAPSLVVQRV
jgi:hypothetical protein